MKLAANTRIKTLRNVQSNFLDRVILRGALGTIVECYDAPEGYAVDLEIPNETLVGGRAYENVLLNHGQFEVVEEAPKSDLLIEEATDVISTGKRTG